MPASAQHHLDVINDDSSDNTALGRALEALNKHADAIVKEKDAQLKQLKTGVAKLQAKAETLHGHTKTALKTLQEKLEADTKTFKPLDLTDQKKMAEALPLGATVAKGALTATEMAATQSVKGINALSEMSKDRPLTAAAIGAGAVAAVAGAGYVVYKFAKNTVKTVYDGVSSGLGWLWRNKWTILTLGAVGGGFYALGKKDTVAAASKAPDALPHENILGKRKEMELEGRKHEVVIHSNGIMELNGKKWEIDKSKKMGWGPLSINLKDVDVRISEATFDPKDTSIRVKATFKTSPTSPEQPYNKKITKDEMTRVVRELDTSKNFLGVPVREVR
jgi:hypothetical protein